MHIARNVWTSSPGQTIATCQRNISQHCRAQHVACVWPPCCDVLRHVGCCWLKYDQLQTWANNTQHVATCRNRVAKRTQHVALNNVAICCAECCYRLAGAFTWANNTQHVATHRNKFRMLTGWANNPQQVAACRNRVAKRTQHVASTNIATCCVGMLRSFGRRLSDQSQQVSNANRLRP